MKNFNEPVTKNVDGSEPYKNSCNETYKHTVRVGGGQRWLEVYQEVGDSYNIVGGGGLTVSAAGGWLGGGGLSWMHRRYGLGIDNVLEFQIILANGTKVTVDECSHNKDLWWALRGGGAGTFGVVTPVVYKIHPVEVSNDPPSKWWCKSHQGSLHPEWGCQGNFQMLYIRNMATRKIFVEVFSFLMEKSVHLDRGWHGFQILTSMDSHGINTFNSDSRIEMYFV